MGWTKVLSESELPAGSRQVVQVDGRKLLLLNHEGTIHAVSNSCPHMNLPMKNGKITPEGELVCPFHRSAFNLCTGAASTWTPFPPVVGQLMGKLKAETPLPVFATRIEDGDILVEVA
ncbi:MAG: Rieske (2Fe-2S) protein [Synechococcales cyanobacterium RM1_1_8]|nr:Rieske (2Fe-2S) protein [Synechococcales cyanobacterium RM1_1_8]